MGTFANMFMTLNMTMLAGLAFDTNGRFLGLLHATTPCPCGLQKKSAQRRPVVHSALVEVLRSSTPGSQAVQWCGTLEAGHQRKRAHTGLVQMPGPAKSLLACFSLKKETRHTCAGRVMTVVCCSSSSCARENVNVETSLQTSCNSGRPS